MDRGAWQATVQESDTTEQLLLLLLLGVFGVSPVNCFYS